MDPPAFLRYQAEQTTPAISVKLLRLRRDPVRSGQRAARSSRC